MSKSQGYLKTQLLWQSIVCLEQKRTQVYSKVKQQGYKSTISLEMFMGIDHQ